MKTTNEKFKNGVVARLKSSLNEVPETLSKMFMIRLEDLVQSKTPKSLKTRVWLVSNACVSIVSKIVTILIVDFYPQHTPIYIPSTVFRAAYISYCNEISDKSFSTIELFNKLKEYTAYFYSDSGDVLLDNNIWEQNNLVFIFDAPTQFLTDNDANLRFLMLFKYLLERETIEAAVLEKSNKSSKFLRGYLRAEFKFKLVSKADTKIPYFQTECLPNNEDLDMDLALTELLETTSGAPIY